MVREWLRLMANENVSPDHQLDFHKTQVKLTALVERFRNSVQKWRGEYDFSHEVESGNGYLSGLQSMCKPMPD